MKNISLISEPKTARDLLWVPSHGTLKLVSVHHLSQKGWQAMICRGLWAKSQQEWIRLTSYSEQLREKTIKKSILIIQEKCSTSVNWRMLRIVNNDFILESNLMEYIVRRGLIQYKVVFFLCSCWISGGQLDSAGVTDSPTPTNIQKLPFSILYWKHMSLFLLNLLVMLQR